MVLQGTMLDPVDGKIRPLTEIAGEYAATFGDIYIEAATRSLSPGSPPLQTGGNSHRHPSGIGNSRPGGVANPTGIDQSSPGGV